MKNSIFCLIAIVCLSFTSFASNNASDFNATINVNTVCAEEMTAIDLNFDSIEDFQEFTLTELGVEEAYCTVAVEVTVSVGVDSTYVSVTMRAENIPCDDVAAAIKRLRKAALAAIQ